MRVVYVVPFFPYPPHDGASIRIWHTLRYLGRRHEIDLVVQGEPSGDSDEQVREINSLVRSLTCLPPAVHDKSIFSGSQRMEALVDALHYPPAFLRRYRSDALVERVNDLLSDHGGADWLLCDTQLSGQIALSPRLRPVRRALCLFDVYDTSARRKAAVTHPGPYKVKFVLDWLKLRHYEGRIMQQFELIAAVSKEDGRIIRARVPKARVVLVPNGVDTKVYRSAVDHKDDGDSGQAPTVLFLGNLSYEPNVDAVRYFLDEIWSLVLQRRPDARFIAAGKDPPGWLQHRAMHDGTISVPGAVADVRPLYEEARVVVAPLRLGAGTKLKILEAMAMGTPVVTTPQGRAGIDAVHGRHLLVGSDSREIAAHVVDLLNDGNTARRLSVAGRELVEQHYDWSAIMARFETALCGS